MVHLMQREVALARHCHAQGSVAEHLDTELFTARTADMLFLNLAVDFGHLLQVQLTGQHHHVGKLGIEFQCLGIGDIELRREVHLLTNLTGIAHHRHIGSNHSRNAGFLGRINNGAHQRYVFIINNGIHREITLHAVLITRAGNFTQIIDGKRIGRTGTHIEVFYTEIDRVGTCLNGCSKRFARTYRSHDFKILQTKTHRKYICYLYQLYFHLHQLNK